MTQAQSQQNKQEVLDKYLASSATLKSIIESENESLKNSRVAEIKNFAAEKDRLISEVEEYKKYLIADKEYLKTLSQATKQQIIQVSESLKQVAEKNTYEVKVAMEVNKLVLEAVHNSVMANRVQAEVYNNSGAAGKYGSAIQNQPAPIKINESI